MDFVSTKFILGILVVIILIVSYVIQYNTITFFEIILAFILGFFSLDVFLISRRKFVKKRMENDLLKAITIMNNSFKSGRSIIETIEIDLLNYLFDKNYTPQMMGSVIKVLSEAYNGLIVNLQMPGWMLCKAIDEAEGTQEATTMYILTVDMIMTLFGAVDGNLDAKEERFIQDFVNRLKRDR